MNKRKNIKVCQMTTIPFAIRFLLLDQIKNLQKEGYEVSGVCAPGKWVKEIEENGIPIKTMNMERKISPFLDLITLFKLIAYFKKEKFDIVHASTPKAGLLGCLAARFAGVKTIIYSNLGFYFQKDDTWFKRQFFILMEKITVRCAHSVFSVARPDIETAVRENICSRKKIKYLGWFIDLKRFNPNKYSSEFINNKKKELKIPEGYKVIGINARLVRDKGYYELFEAFKEVLKDFPQAVLLIIGPKEPKKKDRIDPEIIFQNKKNIFYLGERTDVEQIYPIMDIFVLPSYREGVAVSVLEALAMERPSIGTNVGGISDSIVDGVTGALIPPKNVQALTEKLKYFLNNPEKVRKFGVEGRKKIIKEFNKELVFQRLRAEYERLTIIKVCHVVSSDLTLKFMIGNKLKFLRNQGYDVYAICSAGKWIKEVEKQGVKVKIITLKRKVSPWFDLIAFFKLYFYFRKKRFDIVHTHTLKPNVLGQIAAKLVGVPIIINTMHGFNFGEEYLSWRQKFYISLQKLSGKCSDLIFSISASVTNITIKHGIAELEKVKYLGRDIDIERFNPLNFSREEKKKELGIDSKKKIIGIVARLVEDKGFFELFASFKEVLKTYPEAKLIIVGPNEPEKRNRINEEDIKKYGIEKNISFLGERADVERIYPLMDVFVLPTHREGLGAVLLEASAMEIPVIATNTGGCPEAIDDGETGILIPLKNIEKLTETIIYLLRNPEIGKEMGKKGREKVLREFNEQLVFERLEKEYNRLIQEKL